ncbi:MAG: hypothetical protein QNK04_26535 [Myxococcota bacterium]|nr:hypothetical protein [Myxococcota bacterium]
MIYLEVPTLADILGVVLAAETIGEVKGRFVEEARPGGRLFWENRAGRFRRPRVQEALEALPWSIGEPEGDVRAIGWPELLRTVGLAPDPARRIGRRVVVRTRSEALFAEVVRTHLLLGQGELRYTSPGPASDAWHLSIEDPSLWCLLQLREGEGSGAGDGCTIFSETPQLAGLYLERGLRIGPGPSLGRLFVSPGELLLLDREQRVVRHLPEWQGVGGIVEVTPGEATRLEARLDARVFVTPRLVPAERQPAGLWHASDPAKLESLLARTNPDQLDGYEAWFGADERDTWLRARSTLVDGTLAAELGALFARWTHFGGRVYWPQGRALLPRLDPRSQREMFGVESDSEILVLRELADGQPGSLGGLVLRSDDARPLLDFVRFRAERALAGLETFDSQWEIDLGSLVPRPLAVETAGADGRPGGPPPGGPAFPKDGEPEGGEDEEPVTSRAQAAVRARIGELDADLGRDVRDAPRWRERARCSRQLGNARGGLVADLVASALESPRDLEALAACHREHGTHPELFEAAEDEDVKGRLLAETRRPGLSAEESYTLQLCFAWRFRDADVLHTAVETMRGGFAGGRLAFHRFEDHDQRSLEPVDADEAPPLDVPEADEIQLAQSIRRFRDGLSGTPKPIERIILKQLAVLLSANVKGGLPVDSVLDLPPTPDLGEPWATRWRQLEALPELPEDLARSRRLWLETAAMEGIRSARPEELFVGEVYRPAFTWNFYEASQELVETIFDDYSRGVPAWDAPLRPGSDWIDRAKSQRLLLYLATRYGPLDDFASFVLEPGTETDYYTTLMNCDIYRLSLLFGRRMDEDRFFEHIIERLPRPESASAHVDFRDLAENMLLCLFLSQPPGRNRFLEQLLHRTLEWLEQRGEREEVVDELLGVISYLAAGYVDLSLTKAATRYRFYARLKALWMDHAHRLAGHDPKDLLSS